MILTFPKQDEVCQCKRTGLYIKMRNLKKNVSTKTHVVGTQKNRLNESVLLSTQNK